MPSKGILSDASPVMRRVVLTLRKRNVSSITAAKNVVSSMPKATRAGFVTSRDISTAFAMAEACGRRRSLRARRNTLYGAMQFYGRRSAGTPSGSSRALLATHLQRPIRRRLIDLREAKVVNAAKLVMKYGAAGGSEFHVHVAPIGEYTVLTEKDWTRVNSGKDNWASLVDRHHITVTPRWLGAVRRIGDGFATVDEYMILDAKPFVEGIHRSVWEARLARTGRGFQAVVEDRFLSCYGRHVTIHKTLKKALEAKPPAPTERELDEAALAKLAFA
jgi:hypothetical protein